MFIPHASQTHSIQSLSPSICKEDMRATFAHYILTGSIYLGQNIPLTTWSEKHVCKFHYSLCLLTLLPFQGLLPWLLSQASDLHNHFAPTTFHQELATQEHWFNLRAEQTLQWAEEHEDDSDTSSVPTVWLFSQLPLDSYHSEDDSARDTPPESPAPSHSSIALSISGASQEQEESL